MFLSKRRFKLKIGTEEYTVIGDGTTEHMNAVSELVNNKLEMIKAQMPTISNEKAAVLLAINLASNQLELQQELDEK
nr:cell division protein ZapA [Ligilactobacillus hayakitensis]